MSLHNCEANGSESRSQIRPKQLSLFTVTPKTTHYYHLVTLFPNITDHLFLLFFSSRTIPFSEHHGIMDFLRFFVGIFGPRDVQATRRSVAEIGNQKKEVFTGTGGHNSDEGRNWAADSRGQRGLTRAMVGETWVSWVVSNAGFYLSGGLIWARAHMKQMDSASFS